jgi:RNase P subunit RPR2
MNKINTQTKKGKKQTCKKCNKSWLYTGEIDLNVNYPVYISCPRCYNKVRANAKKTKKKNKGKTILK